MIFVAAGTQDGRLLVEKLLEKDYKVTASVVSVYGKMLLTQHKNLTINDNPLDEQALEKYLKANDIHVFLDASHPYAVNMSKNAMEVCQKLFIPYIRYERQATRLLNYDKIHVVKSYEEAVKTAAALGKNIFLTTGSRNLKIFAEAAVLKEHFLTARVLPDADVLILCTRLGFSPKNIIALQGPFSTELNEELYKKYKADVIVTKNSGTIGGTDTKLIAARNLQLPVVLIDRPKIKYTNIAETIDTAVSFVSRIEKKNGGI